MKTCLCLSFDALALSSIRISADTSIEDAEHRFQTPFPTHKIAIPSIATPSKTPLCCTHSSKTARQTSATSPFSSTQYTAPAYPSRNTSRALTAVCSSILTTHRSSNCANLGLGGTDDTSTSPDTSEALFSWREFRFRAYFTECFHGLHRGTGCKFVTRS